MIGLLVNKDIEDITDGGHIIKTLIGLLVTRGVEERDISALLNVISLTIGL